MLHLKNKQRSQRIDVRHLRRIIRSLVVEELHREEFELGIYLTGEAEMIRLNEQHLGHQGATDVITFDYMDPDRPEWMAGDLFICVPEALRQARQFRTRWEHEIVRYIIHGLLHLDGHDDHSPSDRRVMKREENRLLKKLGARFNLNRLGGHLALP